MTDFLVWAGSGFVLSLVLLGLTFYAMPNHGLGNRSFAIFLLAVAVIVVGFLSLHSGASSTGIHIVELGAGAAVAQIPVFALACKIIA